MTPNTAALVRQMRDLLLDARDDVQAELQRCHELAGRPSTDRRLAAQEQLAKQVDEVIGRADEWLAQQRGPLTDEQIDATLNACERVPTDVAGWVLLQRRAWSRAIERAHGIGQPAGEDKPRRCGPDGCADSACPGRTE